MVEGRRRKALYAPKAKQLTRSELQKKGARDSKADEFIPLAVCGV